MVSLRCMDGCRRHCSGRRQRWNVSCRLAVQQRRRRVLLVVHAFDERGGGDEAELAQQAERPAQHVQYRADGDAQVEQQTPVLDVITIVLQLAAHAVQVGIGRQLNLRQAGDARQDVVAIQVARQGPLQLFDKLRAKILLTSRWNGRLNIPPGSWAGKSPLIPQRSLIKG